MKSKMLIIFLISLFTSIFALPTDKTTAEAVAKKWMNAKSESKNFSSVSEYFNIDNALHVFNFSNGGFVIVAADDASKPILGYSFTDEFNNSAEKSNLNFWIDLYKKAIDEIRTEKLGNEQTVIEWNNILNNNISKNDTKEVLPLLTSTWNQNPIYNMYCPLDGGSLSVVGCVATTMAQIMNYHHYPITGKGSSSYDVLGQTLSVNYYLNKYNWDAMPDALSNGSSDEAKHEIAQISYHAGVAVEMGYGADGSGAYSVDVPYALETYFKYNQSTIYKNRTSYNATTWRNMLQDQLNRSLPVYYSGQGPSGGHAFVCDGYQDTNYYHFNWGWGGSADGYYSIDNLNPGGSTFNDSQGVVIEIVPRAIEVELTDPIDDITTNDASYQIDLSQHFTGQVISYSIDPSSDINGLQYSITDNILTLNKVTAGLSHLVVTCVTRNDNSFDDFYFKFNDNDFLAGFGNSYDFNSTAYLDAGNSSILNAMEKITFSTWIKLNSVGREHGIASKSTSSNTGWSFIVQSNNKLKFTVKTQDTITRNIYGIQTLQADKWYHLDVIYDGKDLLIYINGELDNIKTTYTSSSNILNDTDKNIALGYSNGLFLDGQLDETMLWNQPISVMQVREIMGKRPELPNSSIVAYWTMDEGFYDATYDMTGINDGTFINNDLDFWKDSQAPLYFFMGTNAVLNGILLGSYDETAVYNITQSPVLGNFEITNTTNGDFTYTPNTDESGIEEVRYTITTDKAVTPEKTVFISVKASNGIDDIAAPKTFELSQNYPNPFNPETSISFTLNNDMNTKLVIFDMNGRSVRKLIDGFNKAGKYEVKWDGKDNSGKALSSGVYYYRLSSDKQISVKKAIMLK